MVYSTHILRYGIMCLVCVKPIFHCSAKPLALGSRVGLDPPHEKFALGIPICWYLKTCVEPKFTQCDHLSTQCDPNASRWNIGCVGSPGVGACVVHVDFMLFVSI